MKKMSVSSMKDINGGFITTGLMICGWLYFWSSVGIAFCDSQMKKSNKKR
ncbi:MAG: hypothetical protein ACI4TH_09680 [Candidatus Ornithomonoglobus sp.]